MDRKSATEMPVWKDELFDPGFRRDGKPPLWHRLTPWLFGFITLSTLVVVALQLSEMEEFMRLARKARPDFFLIACVMQAIGYVCTALAWRQTLARAGYREPLRTLIPLGVAKQFADQVVPSGGVSGAILVARSLSRREIPTEDIMAVLLVGLVSYFAAYLGAAFASVVILWIYDRADWGIVVAASIFAVIVIAIPASVLWLKASAHRLPSRWINRFPGGAVALRVLTEAPTDLLRDPMLLVQTFLLQFADFILDAITFWLVFCAVGYIPPVWVVFVAFMIGSMGATLAPIPLGLGTFETACVGMLALLGVAIESALTATLLLRGLTFWLPMLPGLWLARREIG